MKILVNNEKEKDLVARFFNVLNDLDQYSLIEDYDHKEGESSLSTDEYRLIQENMYAQRVVVDEKTPEMRFDSDEVIIGFCNRCGVQTTGRADGEAPTYLEYLEYTTEESQKNWWCETCYENSLKEDLENDHGKKA